MDWKYIGSENAARLLEVMKSITSAIGAHTTEEQIELLQSAVEDLEAVRRELAKQ